MNTRDATDDAPPATHTRVGWKPDLHTVVSALIGLLLVAVAAVFSIVWRNVDVTAEMRKEAREAVLLAEMDAAVQALAVEVDAWVLDGLPSTAGSHPVLDEDHILGHLTSFETAAGELGNIIKPEEVHLVQDMRQMFADYQVALQGLNATGVEDFDPTATSYAEVTQIERAFREALLDLQNEEIEHLSESIVDVANAERRLRWLVPALLVLVIALAFGIRRLAVQARRFREAEEFNAARTEFIASVSHELRTPLAAVVGFAHELRDGLTSFSAQEVEEFAGVIADESREVAGIVEDLLVSARVQAGNLAVLREPVDVRAQIDHVLRSQALLPDNGVEIVGTGEVRATADAARLRQILRNLLANAVRYGGEHIEVGYDHDARWVRLWVADDGAGIPAQNRERIFEPFESGHRTPGVPASVGLGLTVSRQLARAMGGDLSYRYDNGSVLELAIPADQASILSV